MPIINKGTAFSNGEQLTADKINNLLDLATFNQSATDSASTTVNSASQIVVADSGITTAKLATDAVETAKIKDANVTKAKIENMSAPLKVLGRTTAGAGAVEEVAILDEDDLVSNSATALATQQSIKAYVDTTTATTSNFTTEDGQSAGYQVFPSGLKMAWGDSTAALGGIITFPSGVGFTVAPTIQVSYNKATNSGTYYGTQVGDVTTTQFAYKGTYANLHGPRYLAIGI